MRKKEIHLGIYALKWTFIIAFSQLWLLFDCSNNLPTNSIDPNPNIPPARRLMVLEGWGTLEVDVLSESRNETVPTNLYIKMSRKKAELYLGHPIDSAGATCTYRREDTKYVLYFDRNDSVESIDVYGTRIVSGYTSIDGTNYMGIAYGQQSQVMLSVYGEPEERSELLAFYTKRGIGFIFDIYSKRIIGMEIRAPELWIKAGYGTAQAHIGMSYAQITDSLGLPEKIDSLVGKCYHYVKGDVIYNIWFDSLGKANLLLIASDNFIAYYNNNGDTIRKIHTDDSQAQVQFYYGKPTGDTSGGTWWYDAYGIAFGYFSDNLVGGVFVYTDPPKNKNNSTDSSNLVKYCFVNGTYVDLQLFINNAITDTVPAQDSIIISSFPTSNVKTPFYLKTIVSTNNNLYWIDTLMSGTNFHRRFICDNTFFLLQLTNNTNRIVKNVVVANTKNYDSSSVYLPIGAKQNIGFYYSDSLTNFRAYFYNTTTYLNWNKINTVDTSRYAKLLNINAIYSFQ